MIMVPNFHRHFPFYRRKIAPHPQGIAETVVETAVRAYDMGTDLVAIRGARELRVPEWARAAPDERTMYVATPARPYLAAAFETF
jgi:hypothetical protein